LLGEGDGVLDSGSDAKLGSLCDKMVKLRELNRHYRIDIACGARAAMNGSSDAADDRAANVAGVQPARQISQRGDERTKLLGKLRHAALALSKAGARPAFPHPFFRASPWRRLTPLTPRFELVSRFEFAGAKARFGAAAPAANASDMPVALLCCRAWCETNESPRSSQDRRLTPPIRATRKARYRRVCSSRLRSACRCARAVSLLALSRLCA
jgi:hypothetical protein